MEESEVQEKLPEIYEYLRTQEVDWVEIHRGLVSLNWLSNDEDSEVVGNVWGIIDRWGVSLLEERATYLLTSQNRVKLFLIKLIYNVFNSKEKLKGVCAEVHTRIKSLTFISTAEESLNTDPGALLAKVTSAYEDMKKALSTLFLHVDKYFVAELKYTLNNLLDDQFNSHIVQPLKPQISGNIPLKQLVMPYDRYYTPTYGTYAYGVSYTRDNVYIGEIDELRKRHGYGRITFANGDTFEGFWANDRFHGKGVYIWKNSGSYEGDFEYGHIVGKGRRVYASNNLYEGDFLNGRKQGQGKMMFKNGDVYEGEWENDDMHGAGKYTWSSNDYYVGKFARDRRNGKGTLYMTTGDILEGEWKDGMLLENNTSS